MSAHTTPLLMPGGDRNLGSQDGEPARVLEYVSSEERDLVEATRSFARGELHALDRNCDRAGGSVCQALDQMAEMGLMALRVPEQYGGLDCRRIAYAALLHELSYASPSACVTISVHNMVGEMISRFAQDSIKSTVLPGWSEADNLGAFAISEPDAGSDPASASTTAAIDNHEFVINGSKMWITNGLRGRWYVTLVQTKERGSKDGLCMVLVNGEQPGFERLEIEGKMGIRGSDTYSLHLADVKTPTDHLLSETGSGLKLALIALNGGRIGIAAQATGIAEACLDDMTAYAKQRLQFGKPIASFQAIQQMIADSKVELEAAKTLIAKACAEADAGRDYSNIAAMAKLYASEAAGRIADRAVQIHGGSGYVNDYRVEQLYRDVRVTRIYEGTSEIQRLVIARGLLK